MLGWNIAQVLLNKAFKFVLKKKLGHLILGDIHLHQLDLQLSNGLLNLSNIALNADYLNQQLCEAGSVARVKEGSVRSLSVKFPWYGCNNWNWNHWNLNSQGCQVELHDFELVLSPSSTPPPPPPPHSPTPPSDPLTPNPDPSTSTSSSSSNLHQGVKTIATLVKRLLTNFHVSIHNLILAFHTSSPHDHHSLVLRLSQIHCGTCMDDHPPKPPDIFQITHLTNFLNFHGAVLELLHMEDTPSPSSTAPKPLLTAPNGGFSGTINLSIPWNNGSLDIPNLNAQVQLDPIIARLQPTTLKWILATWDLLQSFADNKVDSVYNIAADTLLPSDVLSDKNAFRNDSPLGCESPTDVLLKESQFISDWIPVSTGNCQSQGFEEADLGASVDQFFECFDEMRSYHSALGSSGVWSWTCSVFSAITAASNLASGSLNMSTDQQHVQTNLKVSLAGVSAIFSFIDEDLCLQTNPSAHHLGLIMDDIVLALQVYPQDWKLEALVTRVVLNDYFNQKQDCAGFVLNEHVGVHSGQNLIFRGIQDKVQSALPFSPLFGEASKVKHCGASNNLEVLSSVMGPENWGCCSDILTATLCETSGASQCLFSANSRSSDGCSTGLASFSLKLPPFIFWLSFDLVNMVLDFLREFGEFPRESRAATEFSSGAVKEKREVSALWSPNCCTPPTSRRGGLAGSVFLPHARLIFCFPFTKDRSNASWDQFIALDFSSEPNLKNLNPEEPPFVRENTYWKQNTPCPSRFVHLNVANLEAYHVTSSTDDSDAGLESQRFRAHRVLSFGNKSVWIRLISMCWNKNAVTGAEIMKSAKLYATSHGPAQNMPSTRDEFASVSTWEHEDDLFALKQRLVLSSKMCLHICLPSMVVNLSRSQYLCLFDLLNEATNSLSVGNNGTIIENLETASNQVSTVVECGLVDIILELGDGDCPKSSLQRELPGSWLTLRLEVQKFDLLYVSNIGAVGGAHFLWVSHCEGMLWSTISSFTDQCFLLISCSNTSNGRGDGEGSNVLSCRPAGSDFVYLSDPETSHDFISIILKCVTIVAPGGRLDWLDKISSFFSLPASEVGHGAVTSQKADPERFFFILKFIDAALSYEPYFEKPEIYEECFDSRAHVFVSLDEGSCDPYIACLLAASSLTLSNTKLAKSLYNHFNIRFQDVGLLLHEASKSENVLGEYSVNCLHEVGYVKVAGEALVDAILRINYEYDVTWELCCSESHIILRTCHDTTSGLIRLASQLQQLFAPDMEESLVHLQNRWNCIRQAQGRDELRGVSETSTTCAQLVSESRHLVLDSKPESELVGLMGEICEDAFLLSGKDAESLDLSQLVGVDRNDEGSSSPGASSGKISNVGHTSVLQKAEIMEGYCLSGLRSLSELTNGRHFGEGVSKSYMVSSGTSGWYGRTPLSIVEDYVADTEPICLKQLVDDQECGKEYKGFSQYKGRVVLNNVEVKWQMFAGSDWQEIGQSENICGRDGSVCLELVLSNLNIKCDVFPDGNICASKLCVSVQDFHVYDQSTNAPWKLVLGYYNSKERPREFLSKALKLDLEAVRPDPVTPLEEYRLQIAVLPLLLHLHQSQLDFLVSFFGGKSSLVEQQGDLWDSTQSDVSCGRDNKLKGSGISKEALLPFFQKLDIWPVVVRVDYHPSRVDLAALGEGKYVELVNLVPWKGVELQLKHVQASGLYGWGNVCETALGEWLEDISHNQIHKLLQGLPAIRSFVAVGSGAAKLLSMPVKNYRKDYRLVKGLQRGTISFLRSISVEALGLGVHLAAGAHDILLHAECILARIQPSVPRPIKGNMKANLGSEQPQDARHGLQQAYERLSDGLGKSASALIRTPMKTYQRGGTAGSALLTAVRGAPAAAIAPASAAAQALHCTLVGVRNSLEPERKEESLNKYLGPSVSRKHR